MSGFEERESRSSIVGANSESCMSVAVEVWGGGASLLMRSLSKKTTMPAPPTKKRRPVPCGRHECECDEEEEEEEYARAPEAN